MTTDPRKVIHVDMDAFYASVEQRDRPELRGRPVVVGGSPHSRGVVCAASYEARRFGIRSAMPCASAYARCPQAVFVPVDMPRYKAVSQAVQAVFRRYTTVIEPLALDEAYLDVSDNLLAEPSATRIAEAIRADIRREQGLTASAGVSINKLVAKIASDADKPDGCRVVPPHQVADFLADRPVRAIPGIGPVAGSKCAAVGLERIADLRDASPELLASLFGSRGEHIRRRAWGEDDSPVQVRRGRKSVGAETTFPRDIVDRDTLADCLEQLIEKVADRCQRSGYNAAATVTLKVKYHDFRLISRSRSLRCASADPATWHRLAVDLLAETQAGSVPVRLIGLSLSRLQHDLVMQASLDLDQA